MGKLYKDVAGRDIGRLNALSDGIFAFAMTLLVLDLRVPDLKGITTETDLLNALAPVAPHLITSSLTFLTLGIFWVGQSTQLSLLKNVDRNITWIHIAFLFAVVLEPFSTALLATFINFRIAIVEYWLNILVLGALLLASYKYAYYAKLMIDETPLGLDAVERRIFIAQALYFLGMLLCLVNTALSVGFIFLVQLNYAIAPRLKWLYRL
jgi:uncharacterized membrane protein